MDNKLIIKNELFFNSESQAWLTLFEQNFYYSLEDELKAQIKVHLDKQLLLNTIFKMDAALANNLKSVNERQLIETFPELMDTFQSFWEKLTALQPFYRDAPYLRQASLLTIFIHLMHKTYDQKSKYLFTLISTISIEVTLKFV